MPNQELRHHTALCESGINFRHGHGEEAAFAQLFCGMLRPDVFYAVMKVSPIYTPRPYTVHSDSAVLNLAESERVSMRTALIRRRALARFISVFRISRIKSRYTHAESGIATPLRYATVE